jgi:N-acetylneuraminate epimerase
VAIRHGFGARLGPWLYTGLGSAGRQVFRLDARAPAAGWQRLAEFPGPAPEQPAAAAAGGRIYVFSGAGREPPEAPAPVVLDSVHCYDPAQDRWHRLPTRTPAGLLGASALARADGTIAIFGGYSKPVFDGFMADLAALERAGDAAGRARAVDAFMAMPPEAYRWNPLVLLFDPAGNRWSDLGAAPHLPNTGAALVDLGGDRAMLVGGEVKPGLRTDRAQAVDLSGAAAVWQDLPPLPAGHGGAPQEGLAGAFAGMAGDTLILAGGTSFPGARAAAAAGRAHAHKGLAKCWHGDIFTFARGRWRRAGRLPEGRAHGAGFGLPDGLLLVGGEDAAGRARADVTLLPVPRPD